MLRTAVGISTLAAGAIVIGAGVGACVLFHRPIRRAAKSITRDVIGRSPRARALFDTVQEDLEDVRAEADADRPAQSV
jgi:hypothetical protein